MYSMWIWMKVCIHLGKFWFWITNWHIAGVISPLLEWLVIILRDKQEKCSKFWKLSNMRSSRFSWIFYFTHNMWSMKHVHKNIWSMPLLPYPVQISRKCRQIELWKQWCKKKITQQKISYCWLIDQIKMLRIIMQLIIKRPIHDCYVRNSAS